MILAINADCLCFYLAAGLRIHGHYKVAAGNLTAVITKQAFDFTNVCSIGMRFSFAVHQHCISPCIANRQVGNAVTGPDVNTGFHLINQFNMNLI